MNKKWTYALGIVVLLAFAGFSVSAFNNALTQYVPYETARADAGRTVQVAGGLVEGSSFYDTDTELLHFTLVDEESGEQMKVRYEGLKPANFEEAVSIVAIGNYDGATDEFAANKLLVKCPSKYQGLEEKEYS